MELYYRDHDSIGSMVRVWGINWSGDTFEIMHRDDFETFRALSKPFGIHFFEAAE